MHNSVLVYVQDKIREHRLQDRSVLEVGSRNINGTVRKLFSGAYWGVDMLNGPDVDQVLNAHQLDALQPDLFEVVVSTEMLEHDSQPWVTLEKMRKVSLPDTILILTARGYDTRGCFPVHGYPDDFWRFSVQGMAELLKATDWKPLELKADPEEPGVFATARF